MTKRPTPRKPRGKPIAKRNPTAKAAAPAAQPKPASKPKAGRGADASANRARAFAEAYLTNGHNATAAAIAAGCPAKSAANAGSRLLDRADVQTMLGQRAEKIAEVAGLSAARWGEELRAVLFSSVGDLYGPGGELIEVRKLPRHVQAAIKSIKVKPDGEVIEFKFWDKVAGLGIAARHLGLYERDNAQQSDITVRVELVGGRNP